MLILIHRLSYFILNEKKVEETQGFINTLNEDMRINHARISRDLYFETIDTRLIKKGKKKQFQSVKHFC